MEGYLSNEVNGSQLRDLRRSAGLTLRQVGIRTGYSVSHLSNVERGARAASDGVVRLYRNLAAGEGTVTVACAEPGGSVDRAGRGHESRDAAGGATGGVGVSGDRAGADDFGSRLLRLRLARGYSLAGLSNEIHVSKSYLGNLERGRKRPSAAVAEACDNGLDAAGALIALAAASAAAAVSAPGPAPIPAPITVPSATSRDAGRPEDRDEAAAPVFDCPQDVAAVGRWLHDVRHAGQRRAPLPLAVSAAGTSNLVARSAAVLGGRLGATLWLLAARGAEYTGWLAEEAGDLRSSRDWTGTAVRWAEFGGDRDMRAYAWERRALAALYSGNAAETIALARRGAAHQGASPRVVGLALRREAQGHALDGARLACERLLERSAALLGRGPEPYPRGDSWGPNSIGDDSPLVRAFCLVDIGAFPSAVALFGPDPGACAPAAAPLTRMRFAVRGALAFAGAGDLDHACALIAGLLPDAVVLGSATIRADLARFSAVLNRHPQHAAARALLPDLRSVLRIR